MKRVCLVTLSIVLIAFISCEKSDNNTSRYPYVFLDQCVTPSFESDNIRLCMNEVLSDSRCPANANCIWQGAASAKFTFTKNGSPHPIVLSTLSLAPGFTKDTTIDGYKIEFINLLPYPDFSHTPGSDEIKAEVKITKL
ncbi:MAG: hypothetical protein ABI480_09155 [Chitinophagaceae bacterium]